MRLTVYTDYALRMLTYLALKDGGLATIAEIAEAYGVSRNHLMKVAYELGAAGYVETVRGRGGGLRLAKDPAQIRLGDVVRDSEPDMALVTCFAPVEAPCAIRRCCVLRGVLDEAGAAFLDVLDGHTLADLIAPSRRLRTALVIAPSRNASEPARAP